MAFLVSISDSTHASLTKAMYLDQLFYELIFHHCRSKSDYPILSKIASLKYKSPTLVVRPDLLSTLFLELTKLKDAKPPHPQIEEFHNVCDKAILSGCALTISGDMYPELY